MRSRSCAERVWLFARPVASCGWGFDGGVIRSQVLVGEKLRFMTVLWTVLGALLITVVLAFCITFFIVRPILAKKVNAGVAGLAKELHGRPPLMSTAASCEGCSDPDRGGLKGIGAIALTEQALVFVAGSTDQSVIIPRDKVVEAAPATNVELLGRTVRRSRPMLSVSWLDGHGNTQLIAFTLDEPLQWAASIPFPTIAGQGSQNS